MSAQLTITERLIEPERRQDGCENYTATDSRSACLDRVPIWLSDVLEQLRAIAALPDGWDSNGATSPDIKKVEAAWGLLGCLCENTDLPRPYVNPTRNGGVQFEWEAGERYFEIEVVAATAATYLFCDETAHVEETGCIFQGDDLLEPVRAYIRKVESL